jgi:hypothetical protein
VLPQAVETVIPHPYRMLEHGLAASIGYNRSFHVLRVENRDTFPWKNCLLSLNSHGISSFKLEVEAIEAGPTEAKLLESSEFVDDDGRHFDPTTRDVARLRSVPGCEAKPPPVPIGQYGVV